MLERGHDGATLVRLGHRLTKGRYVVVAHLVERDDVRLSAWMTAAAWASARPV